MPCHFIAEFRMPYHFHFYSWWCKFQQTLTVHVHSRFIHIFRFLPAASFSACSRISTMSSYPAACIPFAIPVIWSHLRCQFRRGTYREKKQTKKAKQQKVYTPKNKHVPYKANYFNRKLHLPSIHFQGQAVSFVLSVQENRLPPFPVVVQPPWPQPLAPENPWKKKACLPIINLQAFKC